MFKENSAALGQVIYDPDRINALTALRATGNLTSESPFEQIVQTVSNLFNVPNVAIHLLDDKNQWVKARVGEDFSCTVEESFCKYALEDEARVWVITNTRLHPLFHDHPLVIAGRIGFYAAASLETKDGYRVGTLCLTNPTPRRALSRSQEDLLQQFATIVIETLELRREFQEAREALSVVAEFDGITGLPNRVSFSHWARYLYDRSNSRAWLGLVRVRLIHTERIKQYAGETGMNQARYEVACRLVDDFDSMEMLIDTSDQDFVFVRYFHNADDEAGAQRILDWVDFRIQYTLSALSEPVLVKETLFHLQVRLGKASFAAADISPDTALDATKIAAEEAGRNQSVWYSKSLSEAAYNLAWSEHELRGAVHSSAFKLAFQPVMCLDNAGIKVCGAEALLRWPGQREPVLGPDEFIPLAEKMGLIDEIGLWVFEQACLACARWSRQLPRFISVNVSPLQLNDTFLPEKFAEIALASGVSPELIKLEITESALCNDFEYTRNMLFRLNNAGFRLALDDFGTGHSSLARVIKLPFDYIKVDRAFVADLPDGPGAAVVALLAQMTAVLGMGAIAEGVETQSQEDYLLRAGYSLLQGFCYARPMSAGEFEEWAFQE